MSSDITLEEFTKLFTDWTYGLRYFKSYSGSPETLLKCFETYVKESQPKTDRDKIKYAKELVNGNYIIHNHNKYRVSSYSQGLGMGHFTWGEYGILKVNEVLPKQLEDDSVIWKDGDNLLLTSTTLQTFENYPFIVIT